MQLQQKPKTPVKKPIKQFHNINLLKFSGIWAFRWNWVRPDCRQQLSTPPWPETLLASSSVQRCRHSHQWGVSDVQRLSAALSPLLSCCGPSVYCQRCLEKHQLTAQQTSFSTWTHDLEGALFTLRGGDFRSLLFQQLSISSLSFPRSHFSAPSFSRPRVQNHTSVVYWIHMVTLGMRS